MKTFRLTVAVAFFAASLSSHAASVLRKGDAVYVYPDEGQARVVCLQVVGDRIVRVRATDSDTLPIKPKSLMIVEQRAKPRFTVDDRDGQVTVGTRQMKATVSKRTGRLAFFDADGKSLLEEAEGGKRFWPCTVPGRDIGTDSGRVSREQRRGLTWQMVFDSPADEAFYGLGQHQAEDLNMKGKNEELFQYNTKVSVPFVISNKNYGLLWDSYSYCRFGQPCDYLQLHQAFRLFDKEGREGHLTGTYTPARGGEANVVVRDEDSIYFEYDLPALQQANDAGGIKNLPQGFSLNGATVVYEGALQAREGQEDPCQFILYYAGYVKVYIGGQLVVPERWRTAWNPNSHKFEARVAADRPTPLRIEWKPDGGVSYCGLRVARRRSRQERGQLSLWSEMAKDMDYYFISGQDMDQVIGGYRTLTGRAPVCPKWALGYWQSRERYKSAEEVVQTLAEFRRRQIPVDNIVQDWNYWPEDQWGSHRFEASRYPDPLAMIDSVHQMHGRFMISVWPKFYANTANYKALDRQGWMYHQATADHIRDWVGPGYEGSFYDAYAEGARKMFWQQLDSCLYTGLPDMATDSKPSTSNAQQSTNRKSVNRKSANRKSVNRKSANRKSVNRKSANRKSANRKFLDAWWMDASEPNVRDCTPLWYRKALCGPTALGTATEYFNAYSLVNAQAIYEGQRSTWKALSADGRLSAPSLSEPRVFQLTRSGFAGLQRYGAATWSGDIGTRWEDMRAQMTAGMNYSLSGLPFWGMDMGGFCVEKRYVAAQKLFDREGRENDDLREWRELQARWAQFAAFTPLFRAHGQWPPREPWHIAPEGHPAYQSFLYYDRLRYHLMPYLYSMAGWVHLRHYTMMRALVMDYGGDSRVLDIKDQWMFGPSLMACPVSAYQARSRSVYFPAGRPWYSLYSGEQLIGSTDKERLLTVDAPYERMPVFVPGGSILPSGPAMQWSGEKAADPITLYVYAGADAHFTLYEDEGTNYDYEQGQYATIDISYDEGARTVTIGRRKGRFPGMLQSRLFRIVHVTKESPRPFDPASAADYATVKYHGRSITVRL